MKIILILLVITTCSACMQLTGARNIDLWGAKFEANTGFEVSAGVQQFDQVLDKKGMDASKLETNKLGKY